MMAAHDIKDIKTSNVASMDYQKRMDAIIDLICIYGEIWHAADSFVEIVKFCSSHNVQQRMTDCNDQMYDKQP